MRLLFVIIVLSFFGCASPYTPEPLVTPTTNSYTLTIESKAASGVLTLDASSTKIVLPYKQTWTVDSSTIPSWEALSIVVPMASIHVVYTKNDTILFDSTYDNFNIFHPVNTASVSNPEL